MDMPCPHFLHHFLANESMTFHGCCTPLHSYVRKSSHMQTLGATHFTTYNAAGSYGLIYDAIFHSMKSSFLTAVELKYIVLRINITLGKSIKSSMSKYQHASESRFIKRDSLFSEIRRDKDARNLLLSALNPHICVIRRSESPIIVWRELGAFDGLIWRRTDQRASPDKAVNVHQNYVT